MADQTKMQDFRGNLGERGVVQDDRHGISISRHLYVLSLLLFFSVLFTGKLQAQSLPPGCTLEGQTVVCVYNANTTFTVPDGVESVTVKAWGAGGGGGRGATGNGAAGGGGGFAGGVFSVTPSSELTVQVGGQGLGGTTTDGRGGSGGGYSGVFNGAASQVNALVVAGAGGGGGGGANHPSASAAIPGAAGGGTSGNSAGGIGGGGGTQSAGGTGGVGADGTGGDGTALNGGQGALGGGETGGTNGGGTSGDGSTGGGGGGAGYFGGGGGGKGAATGSPNSRTGGGGGGGGSGYTNSSGTSLSNIAGSGTAVANSGDTHYESGVGVGGAGSAGNANATNGGAGLVVITYEVDLVYYSRASGDWNVVESWSNEGHAGVAAAQVPSAEDEMIIGGAGGTGHVISLVGAVTITNPGSLTILDTGSGAGTLDTGTHVISGTGTLDLQAGGTLRVGSTDGISASGSTGNIQTTVRNFNTGASYTYNGTTGLQVTGDGLPAVMENLTIDNSNNVESTADTDRTINGQLTLNSGILVMAPGTSLVTTQVSSTGSAAVRMQLEIDGLYGYRMISSPVETDLTDLLDNFITQGVTGSDWPTRQPNFLWFDETAASEGTTANASWRNGLQNGFAELVSVGRGYFFYIFGDMTSNNPALNQDVDTDYNTPLPRTLSATGVETAFQGETPGPFNFGVSYSGTRGTGFDHLHGWNLVGNPTTATLDWDNATAWTRENMDATFYVWDPSANAGAGDYLYWNTVSGTLPSEGLITPFQSFWVKANGTTGLELSFTQDAKVTGGEYVGGQSVQQEDELSHLVLDMELASEELASQLQLSFSGEGALDKDRFDAYRLEPPGGTPHLTFFTTTGSGEHLPLAINHLPEEFEETLRIPLQVGGKRSGEPFSGDFELTWQLPASWPEAWSVTLMDHHTREAIDMRTWQSYPFWHNSSSGVSLMEAEEGGATSSDNKMGREEPPHYLQIPKEVVMNERARPAEGTGEANRPSLMSSTPAARFTIHINPAGLSADPGYRPDEVELMQNYPNPSSGSTTVPFALPEPAEVRLELFDMLGRRVRVLLDSSYPAGLHEEEMALEDLSSGIYIYRLQVGSETLSRKLVIVQ